MPLIPPVTCQEEQLSLLFGGYRAEYDHAYATWIDDRGEIQRRHIWPLCIDYGWPWFTPGLHQ